MGPTDARRVTTHHAALAHAAMSERLAAEARAGRAARPARRSRGTPNLPVGLDSQAQPAAVALGREDPHPGHAEHHRCRRAAVTTVHLVEAFGISSLGRQ
jgi:hypothetical protein